MKLVVVATFVASLLAGCAAGPATHSAADLSTTHGYVYADSLEGGLLDTVEVRSHRDGSVHKMIHRESSDAREYGLWLPPGEYDVYSWHGKELAFETPFEVSTRRVTHLGTFVPIPIGEYGIVLLPTRDAESVDRAKLVVEGMRSNLETTELVDWNPVKPPKPTVIPEAQYSGPGWLTVMLLNEYARYRNQTPIKQRLREAQTIPEFLATAKTIASPLGHHAVSADGSHMYFPGELGQIFVRDGDGQWTTRDTGAVQAITVLAYDRGHLVAGSESGILRISEDDGRTWKIVATVPGAAIVSLDRAEDRWMVVCAHGPWKPFGVRTTHELTVHTASRDDFGDLERIAQFPVDDISSIVWYGSGGFVPSRHAYLLNAPPDVHRLDLSSMKWKKVSPPTNVSRMFVAPGTGFASAYRVQGMFSKIFSSSDAGDTWTEVNTPPYTMDVLTFLSPTVGHATRWSTGAFVATVEVQEYDAATRRWSKTSEAPEGCRRTLWNTAGLPAFCVMRDGSIVRLTDQGWVRDR